MCGGRLDGDEWGVCVGGCEFVMFDGQGRVAHGMHHGSCTVSWLQWQGKEAGECAPWFFLYCKLATVTGKGGMDGSCRHYPGRGSWSQQVWLM